MSFHWKCSLFRRFFFSYVLCKKYIFQQAHGKALRAHNSKSEVDKGAGASFFSFSPVFFFSYVLCKKYIFQQARGKALRAHNSTVNQKSIRERVLLFSNFSMNLTDSPFYYKLPFNILFYYFMEIKTSKISGHSWHRRRNNREIKIHVYAKRQTWICTTWPSFPLIFRLLFIASTQKWVVLYQF